MEKEDKAFGSSGVMGQRGATPRGDNYTTSLADKSLCLTSLSALYCTFVFPINYSISFPRRR